MMHMMMMISRLDFRAPAGWWMGGFDDAYDDDDFQIRLWSTSGVVDGWVARLTGPEFQLALTPLQHHFLGTTVFIGVPKNLLVYYSIYWSTASFVGLLHHLLV